jgi:DNA repair protein SbcD/Mre11
MKFAHMADVHIGSWRDSRMKQKSTEAFCKAIDICIEENIDFLLIAGDLFNTALPAIDLMKVVVKQLMRLKEKSVPVYVIAGSHDYSPGGKTMLDVLEEAGVFINVMRGTIVDKKLHLKFTVDEKTGVKITGILGKAGMLDKKYYEVLDLESLEEETGDKIFMFHTAISEFVPIELKEMKSLPLSFLPKGFEYYAGGHVHYRFMREEVGYGNIVFPGPVFPANFKELEDLRSGSFVIVENGKPRTVDIKLNSVVSLNVDVTNKAASVIRNELDSVTDVTDAFVTIRLKGHLHEGSLSDIGLKEFIDELYAKGAYFVMKNTGAVTLEAFEEIRVDATTREKIEDDVLKEHSSQNKLGNISEEDNEKFIKDLMQVLSSEKQDGEKVADFEGRVLSDAGGLIEQRKA